MSKGTVYTTYNSFTGEISEKGNFVLLKCKSDIYIPVSKISLIEKL